MPKRGALVQSRTLSCMDAAAKPLIEKKGRVHGELLPPLTAFVMPIKEGVKPHQKLSAAGTLL
jgi:hypothetical protein